SQVIQFNAKTTSHIYADIAKRLGLQGNNDEVLTTSLVNVVKQLRKDPCTGTNPREISVEEMKELFIAVYYGKDVNF
ncbi:MAG: hypothetical protein ACRC3Y_02380, partial [Romboutsia sp.]